VPGNDNSNSARSCSTAMLVMPAALICRSSNRKRISEEAFATFIGNSAAPKVPSAVRTRPARALRGSLFLDREIAIVKVATSSYCGNKI